MIPRAQIGGRSFCLFLDARNDFAQDEGAFGWTFVLYREILAPDLADDIERRGLIGFLKR